MKIVKNAVSWVRVKSMRFTVWGRCVVQRWVPERYRQGRLYGACAKLAGAVFGVFGLSHQARATGFTPVYDPTAISTYMSGVFTSAIVPLVAGIIVFFWFLRLLRRAK